jgi:hypothetical protein
MGAGDMYCAAGTDSVGLDADGFQATELVEDTPVTVQILELAGHRELGSLEVMFVHDMVRQRVFRGFEHSACSVEQRTL